MPSSRSRPGPTRAAARHRTGRGDLRQVLRAVRRASKPRSRCLCCSAGALWLDSSLCRRLAPPPPSDRTRWKQRILWYPEEEALFCAAAADIAARSMAAYRSRSPSRALAPLTLTVVIRAAPQETSCMTLPKFLPYSRASFVCRRDRMPPTPTPPSPTCPPTSCSPHLGDRAAQHRQPPRGAHAPRRASRTCAPSRGCSPGASAASCCPAGSASARASRGGWRSTPGARGRRGAPEEHARALAILRTTIMNSESSHSLFSQFSRGTRLCYCSSGNGAR